MKLFLFRGGKNNLLSLTDCQFVIEENSAPGKIYLKQDKNTNKEYEVIKKKIRINGVQVPLTFRRDINSNLLFPVNKNNKISRPKKEEVIKKKDVVKKKKD